MILGQRKKNSKDAIALLREYRSCPQTPVFLGKGLHGMDIITTPTAVEVEKKIFFKDLIYFTPP